MTGVYFDHNATTPVDPRVLEAMLPWLSANHGNPSSVHAFGQSAREAVEMARESVARALGGEPAQCVFTASGTEALNAVVFGRARAQRLLGLGGRLVISTLEHPAIQAAADRLESDGFEVVRLAPNTDGIVEAAAVADVLSEDTFLVCFMLANNEVGTIQPVADVAAGCRVRGIPLLCDAVQAIGKIPVQAEDLGVDYLTLGAHKFYGALGAAALWVRTGAPFDSYLVGGGQERRRRAGTENVPALVALGRALDLAVEELPERAQRMSSLRDRFEAGLVEIGDVIVHGHRAPRLPNTSNVAFRGAAADSLMIRLDLKGYAVSAGSACASGKSEPSGALLSMGVSREQALSSLRISFGITNTEAEVDGFLDVLSQEVGALRAFSTVA